MTGMEKPTAVEFEEFPLENDLHIGSNSSNQLPDYLEEWSVPPSSTTGKVREGKMGSLVQFFYFLFSLLVDSILVFLSIVWREVFIISSVYSGFVPFWSQDLDRDALLLTVYVFWRLTACFEIYVFPLRV